MRVLVVSAWDPRRLSNGACLILHHHLRHLAGDHDVRVLTPEPPPDPDDPTTGTLPEGVRLHAHPGRLPRVADYGLRRLRSLVDGEPAHVHWVERRGLVSAFDAAVAAERPDVVHLFGRGTARLVARVPAGVGTVHVPVDPWTLGFTNRPLPPLRRLLEGGERDRVSRHERRYYPACGAVVVVSDVDARWLAEHAPGSDVVTIANGVEPGPEPGPPAAEPVLAFHGAMDTAANITAALTLVDEVLPLVRAEQAEARAVLIGRDPPAELRQRASGHVEVTGAVDDVRPWLERAAVYVAPMTVGSGMKNKILEAMAAGLPVVASPQGLAGIGAGAGVTEADGVDALARATLELLDDPQRRTAEGAAARRRVVAEFTWEGSARAMERLWHSVAGGRG